MKKIKEQIKILSQELLFELSEEDINSICQEFTDIQKQLGSISEIAVDDVQPTNFCIPFEATPFREDVITTTHDDQPFANCSLMKDQYVVIKNDK